MDPVVRFQIGKHSHDVLAKARGDGHLAMKSYKVSSHATQANEAAWRLEETVRACDWSRRNSSRRRSHRPCSLCALCCGARRVWVITRRKQSCGTSSSGSARCWHERDPSSPCCFFPRALLPRHFANLATATIVGFVAYTVNRSVRATNRDQRVDARKVQRAYASKGMRSASLAIYLLLLSSLLSYTPPSHPELSRLRDAYTKVQTIARARGSRLGQLNSSPCRQLLRCGQLHCRI